MKKVLLGLLALSATLVAESLENTGSSADQSIQINTKAYVIDSGLIITGSSDTAIGSVELDHGRILATSKAASTASKDIYVKKSNGSNFTEGTTLNIGLTSSNNVLTNSSTTSTTGKTTIAHTLTATTDATGDPISLSNTDNVTNGDFTVGNNKSSVKVTLQSNILEGALAGGGFADGEYNNISTLTVKISRIPSSNPNTETR